MIKLVFNPNSNQNSVYKNTFTGEGYLKTTEQDVIPVSSEFNGINYTIQNITYDAYECIFYYRDEMYKDFQYIQSSNKVTIYETGDDARFLADEFEYIEHDSQPFGKEFWEIKVKLRHLESKLTENIIDNRVADMLTIINTAPPSEVFGCYVPFDCIDNIDFENTLANNFKSRLTNYNKTAPYKQIRLYLNNEDMIDFFDSLKEITNYSGYYIMYKSTNYNQFEVEKRAIGSSLFEIDLKLYSNIEITA